MVSPTRPAQYPAVGLGRRNPADVFWISRRNPSLTTGDPSPCVIAYSLQLIVPDAKDAADGTDKFLITVGFGELMKPSWSEHTINTGATLHGVSDDVKKEGTGTITVEDKGKTGKVTFKGKTKDNVGLEGTIDCQQLMRSE